MKNLINKTAKLKDNVNLVSLMALEGQTLKIQKVKEVEMSTTQTFCIIKHDGKTYEVNSEYLDIMDGSEFKVGQEYEAMYFGNTRKHIFICFDKLENVGQFQRLDTETRKPAGDSFLAKISIKNKQEVVWLDAGVFEGVLRSGFKK